GLPKGMFMPPNIEGETKADSTEFSSEETEAQFMDREVDGFDEEKSILMAEVEKNEDEKKDDLLKKILGAEHEINEGAEEEEREDKGLDEEKSILMTEGQKNEDEKKDDLVKKIFGAEHEIIEGAEEDEGDDTP